jgi:hypothetical protein
MPEMPLHNTKQYIDCTIMVINGAHKLLGPTHKAVPTAVPTFYHCYTWLSGEPYLAVKQFILPHLLKNIAYMADLFKQMWFLLTIEMDKLWR